MGLDVYFRRDIANVLRATACASEGATGLALELMGDPELQAQLETAGIPPAQLVKIYRAGFLRALVSVGLGFGLEPSNRETVRQVEHGAAALPSWVEVGANGQ